MVRVASRLFSGGRATTGALTAEGRSSVVAPFFPFSFASSPLSFFRSASASNSTTRTSTYAENMRPENVDHVPPVSRRWATDTTETSSRAPISQSLPRRERSVTFSETNNRMASSSLGAPGGGEGADQESISQSVLFDTMAQAAYTREAVCHLMSLLAFLPSEANRHSNLSCSSSQAQSHAQSRPSSSSVVPQVYEQKYTAHRRRCILDLFRVDFKRVYGFVSIAT